MIKLRSIAFWALLLFFNSIILPTQIFAEPLECREFLSEIIDSPEDLWAFDQNVFSGSIDSTIVWGSTWLNLVQGGKYVLLQGSYFSPGFIITLPMDIGLTIASHFIALESFAATDGLTERQNFWLRAGFNTALGSLVIPTFWGIFNLLHSIGWSDHRYAITPITCLGAAGLCAVVYPTLQRTKHFLFKERPLAQDRARLDSLKENFKEQVEAILELANSRGAELGHRSEVAEGLSLSMLAALMTTHEYEDAILLFPSLSQDPILKKHIEQISELDKKRDLPISRVQQAWLKLLKKNREAKIAKEILAIRRKILDRLLELESQLSYRKEIRQLLALGEGFTEEESLEFHRALSKYVREKKTEVFMNSLIDQMLAVGVAGGLFLYGVNHWAATGETPWFIQWMLEARP